MIASLWLPAALSALALAAVAAGAGLGAAWDHLAAAIRRRITPRGAHRR